jgi:YcxB-like protein
MRIAYVLGEDDLAAVLMQQTLWQRDRVRAWFERIRTGPIWRHLMVNVAPGALFGLMLYPLWLSQIRGTCPRSPVGGIYVGAVAIAVVLGTALQRWKAPPRLRFKGVHRWSARRRLERSRARSVLGDVQVEVGEDGLLRINSTGELRVAWSEVIAVLKSASMLTILLSHDRVIVAPRRAFHDDAAALAFQREIERRSSKQAVEVADTP